jgi:N-acetylglucosaminyl-diphospho-decaprenol L-rhamnosyltransferase
MSGDVADLSDKVTAIVVTHDSARVLEGCVAALRAAGAGILVIDNASADGSVALAESLGVKVVPSMRNEGYGRGNNLGIDIADTPYVLVVNPDVAVEPGAVAALIEVAERHPDAGIVAPQIVEPSGRVFFQPQSLLASVLTNPAGKLAIPEDEACVPFVSGACLLIRREIFLDIGGFDTEIFLFYEDDDLCRRMMDADHAVIYAPQAVVRHRRGKSSASRPGRIFTARWHLAWSRCYVSRKYGLPDPALKLIIFNWPKGALAWLVFNRRLAERYLGTAYGAWAFMWNTTALERQRLN